ncbi:MAG: DUF1501 domain-containing protein [Polyangiaceae bacterium]
MERRDFIKLCSMTGLAVVAGAATDKSARGESTKYTGPFWVYVSQGGGWDVTSIMDPKGAPNQDAAEENAPTDTMNRYLTANIRKGGVNDQLRWAALSESADIVGNAGAVADALVMEQFFEDFQMRLRVINGIDMMTNAHDVGSRAWVSGNLAENTPAFLALVAAELLPGAPMAFVSFGGYSETSGLTSVTRLGNIGAIQRLAYPHRRYGVNDESYYMTDETEARVAKAREERFNAKMQAQRLPRVRTAMNTLYMSRLGQNELKQLVDYLPENLLPGIAGQVQLAAAAYKAGLCVGVSVSTGGWDTHGNNDTGVAGSVGNLFDGLRNIDTLLGDLQMQDNSVVVCGSDFGRTPGYNMGNGKDHWAVNSMLMWGAVGGKQIEGGISVGGTTEEHLPLKVNPDTGAVDPNGIRIQPGHVQNSLRRLAGIETSDSAKLHPVAVPLSELPDLVKLA